MSQQKPTANAGVGEHGLKKKKIGVSTVVFMIFCLVAAGCYGIEEAIPDCGPGLTIVMLCVMPFVWAMPLGLVASELGSVRPQEGGYYKWVQEALGEFWGFQAGWWRTISIYIDNVSYVILAGGFVASYWDLSKPIEFVIKAAMIIVFVLINIRGIKDVGIVSTILSLLVMVAFAMVAVCGFLNWGEGTDISFQMTAYETTGPKDWFMLIAGGISVIMWMYSGYESMSTIAGEIEDPQVIPKGTMLTIPLIMASYILPTVAGLGSMGRWTEWGSAGEGVGYGDVVQTFWGAGFGIFFVIVSFLAQCSIFNTYIASGSRGFFSLADDYLAPPIMVKCDKKNGVPYVTVLSIGIFSMALCMCPFGLIIIFDTTLLAASYIMIYISAIILRKRIPREEYKFRIPGGDGFLKVLCVVPICVAIFALLINGSDYFLGGMVGLMTGPLLYFIWRRKYGGLTRKDSTLYPANPKTGLAVGDTKKISFLLMLMSILNIVAVFFAPWYEGWGTADGPEAGDFFDGMFPHANVDILLNAIQIGLYIVTAISVIGCIVFYILSKKIEPQKK